MTITTHQNQRLPIKVLVPMKNGLDILNAGLKQGYIYTGGYVGGYHEYFGKASDGVTVHLGMSDEKGNPSKQLLSYLEKHPNPTDW